MADVVKGSVLLTPRFDNLTSTVSRELEGAFGSSRADRAGGAAARLFGSGFAARAGAISGVVQGVASKAMDAISGSIGSAVARVDTLANYPKVMSSLGVSTDVATASISSMGDHLSGLPTRLDAMASSVQGIYAACSGMGVGLNEATAAGLGLNDMLLAGGQGSEVAEAAMVQFTQALSKGKPDMQDWRSLTSAAPAQMNQLAQAMLGPTKNSTDLYKAIQDGSVSMADMLDAISTLDTQGGDGFASFADQAKSATGGIATSWSNLQNSVTKAVASVINAIGPEAITAPMQAASGLIKGLGDDAASVVTDVKGYLSDLWASFAPQVDLSPLELAGGYLQGISDSAGAVLGSLAGLGTGFVESGAAAQVLDGALQALDGAIGLVTAVVQPAADWVRTLLDRMSENGTLQAFGDAAQAVGDALKSVMDNASLVVDDLTGVGDSSDTARGAADLLKASLDGVRDVAELVGGAFDAMSRNLDAVEPAVVAVATAIGAVKVSSGVTSAAKTLGDLGAAVSLAKEAVQGGGGVLESVSSAFGALGSDAGPAATAVGSVAGKLSSLKAAAEKAGGGITGLSSALGIGPWGLVAAAIAAVVAGLVWFFTQTETGRALWAQFTQFLSQAWDAAVQALSAGVSAVASFFTVTIPQALQSALAWLQQLPAMLLGFVQQLPVMLATALGLVIGVVAGLVVSLVELAIQAGQAFLTNLVGFFTQLPGQLMAFLQSAIAFVASFAAQLGADAIQAGTSFVQGVVTFFAQLPGQIAAFLASAIAAIASFAASLPGQAVAAGQGFLSGIQSGFQAAVSFVQGIPGQITGFFAGAGSWLVDSGKALLDGFTSGIRNGFQAAKDAVSNGLSAIRDFFPFSPAKVGPFSGHGYTTYSGRALMEGLAEGVGRGTASARASVKAALEGVRSEMSAQPLRFAASADRWRPAGGTRAEGVVAGGAGATVVNQTFNTRVVRSDEDIYAAAAILNRAAVRTAMGV